MPLTLSSYLDQRSKLLDWESVPRTSPLKIKTSDESPAPRIWVSCSTLPWTVSLGEVYPFFMNGLHVCKYRQSRLTALSWTYNPGWQQPHKSYDRQDLPSVEDCASYSKRGNIIYPDSSIFSEGVVASEKPWLGEESGCAVRLRRWDFDMRWVERSHWPNCTQKIQLSRIVLSWISQHSAIACPLKVDTWKAPLPSAAPRLGLWLQGMLSPPKFLNLSWFPCSVNIDRNRGRIWSVFSTTIRAKNKKSWVFAWPEDRLELTNFTSEGFWGR